MRSKIFTVMKLHCKRVCESEKSVLCITNNCLKYFQKKASFCNACLTNYTKNYALWYIA